MKSRKYLALGFAGILTACATPQKQVAQRPSESYRLTDDVFREAYANTTKRLEKAKEDGVMNDKIYSTVKELLHGDLYKMPKRNEILNMTNDIITHEYTLKDLEENLRDIREFDRQLEEFHKHMRQFSGQTIPTTQPREEQK